MKFHCSDLLSLGRNVALAHRRHLNDIFKLKVKHSKKRKKVNNTPTHTQIYLSNHPHLWVCAYACVCVCLHCWSNTRKFKLNCEHSFLNEQSNIAFDMPANENSNDRITEQNECLEWIETAFPRSLWKILLKAKRNEMKCFGHGQ